MKHFYIITFLLISFSFQAQENTLLRRDFWKKKPTIAILESEIKNGNDPTELDVNSFDATTLAINELVSNDVIKYLLNIEGNDVNKLTHDNRTYLFWAAYRGNLEIMQNLVDKGAKTDHLDAKGYSVFNFAASTGQTNTLVYDFCIKHGTKPTNDFDNVGANAILLVAPYDKDFKLMEYFISKGLHLNTIDKNGFTAIDYAAKTGNSSLIKLLLEKNLKFSDNAMIMASQAVRGVTNSLEVYQFLEEIGINPKAIGKNGENALHSIVKKDKQDDVINYFLSKGVSVDLADNDGNTPLINAAATSNLETISLLSSYSKNLNWVNKKGISALAMAFKSNTADVINFLIKKGAKLTVLDANKENLVSYAIQSYNPKKADELDAKLAILKQNNIDIISNQENGNSLYHLAITKNDLSLLKLITPYKIDVNHKNNDGITVLHKAALLAKDDSILKYLISIGANKKSTTEFDETAYDLASENENLRKNKVAIDFLK